MESPFAGSFELNVEYGRACLAHSLRLGEAPLASHLLYTQPDILDDDNPQERALGIAAGHAWTPHADAVVVYIDSGISKGMQQGIDAALQAGIPVEFRALPGYKFQRPD